MIPDTYNIKREFYPNVCKSCNWLCNAFRIALMDGDRDKAMAIYSTGNVNLYTPFANVKGELFYPVHCAVLGDSLDLLRFLVDDHCCPIQSARGTSGRSSQPYVPIATSKGRSLLGMALANENLEIVRYLLIEKGVDVATEPGVTMDLLCRNFLKVLHFLPSTLVPMDDTTLAPQFQGSEASPEVTAPPIAKEDPQRSISEEARDFGAVAMKSDSRSGDECKSCFDSVTSRLNRSVVVCCRHHLFRQSDRLRLLSMHAPNLLYSLQ